MSGDRVDPIMRWAMAVLAGSMGLATLGAGPALAAGAPTTTTLSCPAVQPYGSSGVCTVTVTAASGPTPTGTVSFSAGPDWPLRTSFAPMTGPFSTTGTCTLVAGQCSTPLTAGVNEYDPERDVPITADYTGDAGHVTSTDTVAVHERYRHLVLTIDCAGAPAAPGTARACTASSTDEFGNPPITGVWSGAVVSSEPSDVLSGFTGCSTVTSCPFTLTGYTSGPRKLSYQPMPAVYGFDDEQVQPNPTTVDVAPPADGVAATTPVSPVVLPPLPQPVPQPAPQPLPAPVAPLRVSATAHRVSGAVLVRVNLPGTQPAGALEVAAVKAGKPCRFYVTVKGVGAGCATYSKPAKAYLVSLRVRHPRRGWHGLVAVLRNKSGKSVSRGTTRVHIG